MAIQQQVIRYGQLRLARRLGRSLPWIGAVVALAAVGSAIRRKGWLGGLADSALNAMPVVGGVKNVAEVVRGREFFRDRTVVTPDVSRNAEGGRS